MVCKSFLPAWHIFQFMNSHLNQQAYADIPHTPALGDREELHRDVNVKLPSKPKSVQKYSGFFLCLLGVFWRFVLRFVLGSSVVPLDQSRGIAMQVNQ